MVVMAMSSEALPKVMAFLDKNARTISKLGINYQQYRLIVQTKFELASRDHVGLGFSVQKKVSSSNHDLRNSFLLYLFFGLLIGAFLLVPLPHLFALSSVFATIFVMVFLTMLTSYSSLMLDPRDRPLYVARGVSERTLSAARITVVGFYLLLNVVAIGLPSVLAVVVHYGPVAVLGGAIALLLLGLFSFMLALFVYLLVLRFFDGERLKNVLNMVQIVMVIGIYLAGQVLPRMGNALGALSHVQPGYYLLALPSWFAGPVLLTAGDISLLSVGLTLLAVGVTAALTFLFWHNAGRFEQYLAKLDQASDAPRRDGWYVRFCRILFTRDAEERGYFDFAWRVLREERDFKLRVYPQLAYSLIIPVIFLFTLGDDGASVQSILQTSGRGGAYALLMFNLALPIAIYNLGFSSQPEAMRLFQRVPLRHDGRFLRACMKVLFARLVLPLCLPLVIVFALIGGLTSLIAGIGILFILYGITLLMGRSMVHTHLPFSQLFDASNQKGTPGMMGIMMLIVPADMAVLVLGTLLHSWIVAVVMLVIGIVLSIGTSRMFEHGVVFNVRAVESSEH
jgi:hypothetical protein